MTAFDVATTIVGSLPKDGPIKPTQNDQLEFYALYKQATVGPCLTEKPGAFDFTGKFKWRAWMDLEDMDSESAKNEYVRKLKALLSASDDAQAKTYLQQLQATEAK